MKITEKLAYYWLSLSGTSVRRLNKLIEQVDVLDVWENINDIKLQGLLGERNLDALKHFKNLDYLERSLDKLDKDGIKIITRVDESFPECLAQTEVDPPLVLYYKGNVDLLSTTCVGIVGTRKSSFYGREMARKFSRELSSSGLTIVSGLATGIDGYAHEETLKNGGSTIAVLGTGLNNPYPASNYKLFCEIVEKGCVISEYEPNMEGSKYTFPARNRIISGLSRAILVVEAGIKSGSLITADYALEQGRELCIVPANIGVSSSMGSNEYLRKQIAHCVLSGQDVCKTIDFIFEKSDKKTTTIQLDIYEEKIYNLLQNGDESFDNLILSSGLSPQDLSAAISTLELLELIKKTNANIYSIVRN